MIYSFTSQAVPWAIRDRTRNRNQGGEKWVVGKSKKWDSERICKFNFTCIPKICKFHFTCILINILITLIFKLRLSLSPHMQSCHPPVLNKIPCPVAACSEWFKNHVGVTNHVNIYHPNNNTVHNAHCPTSQNPSPFPGAEHGDPFDAFDNDFPAPCSPSPAPTSPPTIKIKHPRLTAQPCDANGTTLPPGTPPLPHDAAPEDWSSYENEV